MRADAFGLDGEQLLLRGREELLLNGGQLRVHDAEDVLLLQRRGMRVVLEVAFLRDAEVALGHFELLGGEQLGQLVLRPAVELPFVPFAVRVFR